MLNRPLPPVSALSPAALFFDDEGIPVSLGEPLAGEFSAAWDQDPSRRLVGTAAEQVSSVDLNGRCA